MKMEELKCNLFIAFLPNLSHRLEKSFNISDHLYPNFYHPISKLSGLVAVYIWAGICQITEFGPPSEAVLEEKKWQ